MKEVVTRGTICLDDDYNFTYCVAGIRYIEREDESFCYEIRPNYSVISLLSDKHFQGIPGLDLNLKKAVYVRENVVPVFISEIRTDTIYPGDGLYVCKKEKEFLDISSIEELGNRSSVISRRVLEAICSGGEIVTRDFTIDDTNRKVYYELFMAMYRTERKYLDERRRDGIKKASAQGKYVGRSRIKIDKMELNDIFDAYEAGKVSGREAANLLQISASTFFRRYREYKNLCQ